MKLVRGLVGGAAVALLAGCAEEPPPPAPPPAPVAQAAPVDPECRTVKIFSPHKITRPGRKIPDGWKAFSGVWGKGAWDNKTWCHDLYVMKIEEDGKVTLMDAHGPGGRHDGTAFRRVGQIHADNRLRFTADGIVREYWIEDGKLRGIKHISETVKSEITLNRKS